MSLKIIDNNTSAIKKKKHVSKKNKKAWRKYCDIKDVEEFLEDQRLEERIGKFETRPDEELFVVDTAGDEKAEVVDVKPLTLKQKKRAALLTQTPKCYEVLLPASKVKDPKVKRNHVNPVGSKATALSKLTQKRRFEKGTYQKKVELVRMNRKLALNKRRKMKEIQNTFNKNLWGDDLPEEKSVPSSLRDDFISTEALLHNVPPEKRLLAKPPPPKVLITRPAIDTPHPGVSYNPSYQEHQDLLQDVVQHEQKMIKKEAHLNRVTTKMFKKVTAKEKENQWLEEMSAGLPHPHNPATTQSDDDTDNEYKAINPPVKNKKKDHKARRKQKERIEERERLKKEKIDKKKITDIYKLRKLQTSISAKEKRQAELQAKRSSKRALLSATALPALNANKVPVKQPDLVEPLQLSGDLRSINTNINLLRDRFESLQRRGALAASKVMMKKKKRVKSFFKPGHKVTDKDVDDYLQKMSGKKAQKKKVIKK